jgi:hypothetical protein
VRPLPLEVPPELLLLDVPLLPPPDELLELLEPAPPLELPELAPLEVPELAPLEPPELLLPLEPITAPGEPPQLPQTAKSPARLAAVTKPRPAPPSRAHAPQTVCERAFPAESYSFMNFSWPVTRFGRSPPSKCGSRASFVACRFRSGPPQFAVDRSDPESG